MFVTSSATINRMLEEMRDADGSVASRARRLDGREKQARYRRYRCYIRHKGATARRPRETGMLHALHALHTLQGHGVKSRGVTYVTCVAYAAGARRQEQGRNVASFPRPIRPHKLRALRAAGRSNLVGASCGEIESRRRQLRGDRISSAPAAGSNRISAAQLRGAIASQPPS